MDDLREIFTYPNHFISPFLLYSVVPATILFIAVRRTGKVLQLAGTSCSAIKRSVGFEPTWRLLSAALQAVVFDQTRPKSAY